MNKRFKKTKNKYYYLKVAVIGTIIATFFWFSFCSKKLSSKIISIAAIEADQRFYKMTSKIVKEQVKNENLNDFLAFTKNKDNELILTSYNLNKVYEFLEKISKYCMVNNDYIFFIPSGMISNHFLLNNLGTKIPIRAKLVNNLYANIKTKITNYGLNNALAEMYVVIEMKQAVISPFSRSFQTKQYEILISTFFITGKVPFLYGDKYEISSNIFDISRKI